MPDTESPDRVTAPFTNEQVDALNKWQRLGYVHPFTCCSHETCKKHEYAVGTLTATTEGWVCPCGKYTQDWAHSYMADEAQHPADPFAAWRKRYVDLIKVAAEEFIKGRSSRYSGVVIDRVKDIEAGKRLEGVNKKIVAMILFGYAVRNNGNRELADKIVGAARYAGVISEFHAIAGDFLRTKGKPQTNLEMQPLFKSTHNLDFYSGYWDNPFNDMNVQVFRCGTCHGQWLDAVETYDIISIINADPGNGHFTDVLEWFENSCKRDKKDLRICELVNDDFKRSLIEKHGFVEIPGTDDVIKKYT